MISASTAMKKTVSTVLAGVLATGTLAATTSGASAHDYRTRHHHPAPGYSFTYRGDAGAALAAGAILGLAAGAFVGAIATPPPPPPYGYRPAYVPQPYVAYPQPAPVYGQHASWCAANYPNYNPRNNTWIDAYGRAQLCYSPY